MAWRGTSSATSRNGLMSASADSFFIVIGGVLSSYNACRRDQPFWAGAAFSGGVALDHRNCSGVAANPALTGFHYIDRTDLLVRQLRHFRATPVQREQGAGRAEDPDSK